MFFFLFPSGPLKCPRLSFTPYLLSMRKMELRLHRVVDNKVMGMWGQNYEKCS